MRQSGLMNPGIRWAAGIKRNESCSVPEGSDRVMVDRDIHAGQEFRGKVYRRRTEAFQIA